MKANLEFILQLERSPPMSRQQDRVLRAMISLREFTVSELQEYSGVLPATVRTVISRFNEAIEPLGRMTTGKRGGQNLKYRLRDQKVGPILDRILSHTSSDMPFLEEERRRLLDLSSAHETLLKLYVKGETFDERNQLLDLVSSDLAAATKQLTTLPPEDAGFARYAQRIEEIRSLYHERRQFLSAGEKTDRELTALEAIVEGEEQADRSEPAFVIVDADPGDGNRWNTTLCRELDKVASHARLVELSIDRGGWPKFGWPDEPIGGCIVALDSSRIGAELVLPAIEHLQVRTMITPVLVVDAQANTAFQRTITASRAFYTSRQMTMDAAAVLHLYLCIVQSFKLANHVVVDRTMRFAAQNILDHKLRPPDRLDVSAKAISDSSVEA